jgi:AraC family transcriptional activator FtrA
MSKANLNPTPAQQNRLTQAKRVGIVASDQGALFELGCAVELFGLPRPEFSPWYQCQVITLGSADLSYTAGVGITATPVPDFNQFDLLVIPHWYLTPSDDHEQYYQQLQAAAQRGCQILSFCSGAFLLAEAGLLDNKEATTHWRFAKRFKQRFPSVSYVDNVLYCFDGNIGCSAGSAAGLGVEYFIWRINGSNWPYRGGANVTYGEAQRRYC